MKTFNLKALTIALGLTVFSVSANATPLIFENGVADFGNIFSGVNGSFSDTYTFEVSSGFSGLFSASVSSYYSAVINTQIWGINITGLSLSGPSPLTGTEYSTSVPGGLGDYWTLSGDLAAGSYSLAVSGYAKPEIMEGLSFPVSYGGEATLEISAVPEPETYGMMLAGLGLMGFVAARRKSV